MAGGPFISKVNSPVSNSARPLDKRTKEPEPQPEANYDSQNVSRKVLNPKIKQYTEL